MGTLKKVNTENLSLFKPGTPTMSDLRQTKENVGVGVNHGQITLSVINLHDMTNSMTEIPKVGGQLLVQWAAVPLCVQQHGQVWGSICHLLTLQCPCMYNSITGVG